MNKKFLNDVPKETFDLLRKTSVIAEKEDRSFQLEQIQKVSSYSKDINNAFAGYEEYEFLSSLNLKEAVVTRKALVKEIDFNLYITCKQKTNFELMSEGSSPYLTDNEDDIIVIHHIGQAFNAPFAELTATEHLQYGNNKKLHNTKLESWRNDPDKLRQFQTQRIAYWKQRAAQNTTYILKGKLDKTVAKNNYKQKSIIVKIKEPLEKIFSACSIEDLKYISNMANGYILAKQVGGKSIEDFMLSTDENIKASIKCTKCKSKNYIYYGYQETSHEKKQRYKCKDCGNVFSLFNNTIISGCSFSFVQWMQFIDCLYNGYSLEKTAKLCNISVKSAFDNRLRLFYALKVLEEKVILRGNIVIDETYIVVSHKGNRTEQPDFELIRPPRKRGGENHVPGTSKEQVCIVCALDSYNNSVAKLAGLGAPTAEKIDFVLKKCIDKNKVGILYSDNSYAIKKFAEKNRYKIEQATLSRKKHSNKKPWVNKNVQKINSYHSRLKKFISTFSGVSSELIQGYMYLFSWKDRNRNKETIETYKELLSVMIQPGLFKSIEQIEKEKIIESAIDLENMFTRREKKIRNYGRYKEIYERWSRGENMQEIGDTIGMSRQRVHQMIDKFRKLGFAYTTEFEKKRKKEREEQRWEDKHFADSQITFQRDYSIYLEFEKWSDSNKSFYEMAAQKYGLSVISIKNRISEVKRVLKLRKVFYVYEKYDHLSLKEMFELVYKRYNEILNSQPNIQKTECYKALAEEFGYSVVTIQNLICQIKKDKIDWDKKAKIKTPLSQGLNRDISVFIDFMKWTGTRGAFFEYAKEKYGIAKVTTQKILHLNYLADPKRFEITKMY